MRKSILIFVLMQSFVLTLIGQNISTNAEIYNFDIGDVFHYLEVMGGQGSATNIESNIIITGKYYSSTNDTLFYTRNITKRTSSSFAPTVYKYIKDTISYSNLSSPVNSGIIDSVYVDPAKYNGRKINRDTTGFVNLYVDSLGKVYDLIYYEPLTLTEHSIKLVYYKKGSEIWGNPIPLNIYSKKQEDVVIKTYPNPASTIIYFDFKNAISKPITITIYNLLGQQVIEVVSLKMQKTIGIDLSTLKKGVYFYKSLSDNKIIGSGRFIKI